MTVRLQHSRIPAGTSLTTAAVNHCASMRPVVARQWQKQTPGVGFQT